MRLLQFGDSLLPVGAFSFSCGLESAVEQKIVRDVETLEEFVRDSLLQAAMVDGIALLETYRATQKNDSLRVIQIDQSLLARKLNEETRLMSLRMGKKLGELAMAMVNSPILYHWNDLVRTNQSPGNYSVGQGIVFHTLSMRLEEAFAVHQYGIASMILGAALRLMKLHHLDSQKILFRVSQEAPKHYNKIASLNLEDMGGFAPVIDILAAIHVKSRVRLFMN